MLIASGVIPQAKMCITSMHLWQRAIRVWCLPMLILALAFWVFLLVVCCSSLAGAYKYVEELWRKKQWDVASVSAESAMLGVQAASRYCAYHSAHVDLRLSRSFPPCSLPPACSLGM
jgi:hypothetical protein